MKPTQREAQRKAMDKAWSAYKAASEVARQVSAASMQALQVSIKATEEETRLFNVWHKLSKKALQ